MTTAELLITVGLVALTTVAIRALPFWLFPAGKKPPAFVAYLGRPLPAAVMAMLVVYFRLLIFSMGSMVVSFPSSYRSLAMSAAPKAPMIPAISGRMASQPAIFSKLLSTASL